MKRLLPVLMGFALLLLFSTEGWSLPPCSSKRHSTNPLWTDCFGTYTYAKSGNKYVGEFKDGKRNGQGTYTYADGNKYAGEFRDNKRNGQGTLTYANGDKYVGGFKDGRFHGQGTWTGGKDLKGNRYIGAWKDNKMHGQGTLTLSNGRIEEGTWENGKFLYAKKPSLTN